MFMRAASGKAWTQLARLIAAMVAVVLLSVTCAAPISAPPANATVPPPVTVDLSTKTDSQGILFADFEVVSSDGRAKLNLAKGTQVLDTEKRPAKFITVTAMPRQPDESKEAFLSGLAYDFGTLTIKPAAQLTISYDPPPAFVPVNSSSPEIGGLAMNKIWVKPQNPSTTDPKTRTVTLQVGTGGTFVVLFWYAAVTPPIS